MAGAAANWVVWAAPDQVVRAAADWVARVAADSVVRAAPDRVTGAASYLVARAAANWVAEAAADRLVQAAAYLIARAAADWVAEAAADRLVQAAADWVARAAADWVAEAAADRLVQAAADWVARAAADLIARAAADWVAEAAADRLVQAAADLKARAAADLIARAAADWVAEVAADRAAADWVARVAADSVVKAVPDWVTGAASYLVAGAAADWVARAAAAWVARAAPDWVAGAAADRLVEAAADLVLCPSAVPKSGRSLSAERAQESNCEVLTPLTLPPLRSGVVPKSGRSLSAERAQHSDPDVVTPMTHSPLLLCAVPKSGGSLSAVPKSGGSLSAERAQVSTPNVLTPMAPPPLLSGGVPKSGRSLSAERAQDSNPDVLTPLASPPQLAGNRRKPITHSQSARPARSPAPWNRPPLGSALLGAENSDGGVHRHPVAGMPRSGSHPGLCTGTLAINTEDVEHPGPVDPYAGMSPFTKAKSLSNKINEETDALKRSSNLLAMYVNRSNSSWADSQQWKAPDLTQVPEFQAWLHGDVYLTCKVEAERKLRRGAVALQFFAADDYFTMANGKAVDVWNADPWQLVDTCRPGIMPTTDRVEGVPMGPRCICNAILALTDTIGSEAVQNLNVLLHLNEEQEAEVTQDFWKHKFYGLKRTNVIFLVERRHPGYRYCWEDKSFTAPTDVEAVQSMGSGYSIAQMAWASEAFMMSEEGLHEPLALPTIEHLLKKKVEWVVSRRCRDLALYSRDNCSAMDIKSLAFSIHQKELALANMVVEVAQVKTLGIARQYDSIVLQHANVAKSISKENSDEARKESAAAAMVGLSKSFNVIELRHCELNTPKMIKVVESLRNEGRGTVPVGMNRCTYHLPAMKNLLSSFAVFRPKLMLKEELLHVSLDLTDITAADKARCVAMEARQNPGMLLNPRSLDALIPMAQDHDISFRELIMTHHDNDAVSAAIVSRRDSNANGDAPPHTIVVFVVNNSVSQLAVHMAACIAKPGRDMIRLVTFVSLESQKSDALSMLQGYSKGVIMKSMTVTHCDAVVRGSLGLLDAMEKYVVQLGVDSMTVVMGSAQLTSNVFDYVVGSVTLSAIKRLLGIPVIVVTANSKTVLTLQPGAGFRYMAVVEGHSKNMLQHVCTRLVDMNRGDKMLLAQVLATRHLTRQQQVNSRRIVDNFHSICHGLLVPVSKTSRVEGQFDLMLCELVEEGNICLLGLQLTQETRTLTTQMLNLLRSNRGATLVYQDAGDKGLLRRSEDVPTP
eukprot:gene15971-22102_t